MSCKALAFAFEQELTLWLNEVNAEIYQKGAPLSTELREIATELGVTQVDEIRILVVDEVPTPSELMHVRQIERFGSLQDFVMEYLRQVSEHGYFDAPLEAEAFEQNTRYGRDS